MVTAMVTGMARALNECKGIARGFQGAFHRMRHGKTDSAVKKHGGAKKNAKKII